jgi:N-acetylmuramate 1-kinase
VAESRISAGSASSGLPEEARSFLAEWLGSGWTAEALRGDASIRRYYRISSPQGASYMLAYYPPELREQASRFLGAYGSIHRSVRVPEVIRSCSFAVAQQDVGDFTLFDLLHHDREKGLAGYRESLEVLVAFQRSPPEAGAMNPPFDASKFEEELEMTLEFYLGRLIGARSNDDRITTIFSELSRSLTRHPYLLTHRDFHGQNIHIFKETLYIIDYQDLRMGPDTYDLASLLRDRGVAALLGREQEERLIAEYARLRSSDGELRGRYLECLLQRSIKIIGTFARQAITRDRDHYLKFIPGALQSVRFCLAGLPQYEELLHIFPLDYGTD